MRNESDHTETIGVYLDVIPPGGITNPGECQPYGRILETTVSLASGRQANVIADSGTIGDDLVEFFCTNQSAVVGQKYQFIAVADAHADDLQSCAAGSLQTSACFGALADDDGDSSDNRAISSKPRVQ